MNAPTSRTTLPEIARRLGFLSVLAVAAAALPAAGGFVLLSQRQAVADWLAVHHEWGLALYVVGFAVTAGLAVLPTYAQAIIGGFVFRFVVGFPAAMAGFLGGAVIGYAAARLAAGDRATRLIREHPQAQAISEALIGAGYWRTLLTVTLIRLPPNSPFALANLALAAAGVPLSAYVLGTLLGMAPRTAAMIYVGSQLKSLAEADRPAWMFWAGVALTLLVLGILGQLLSRALAGAKRAAPATGA